MKIRAMKSNDISAVAELEQIVWGDEAANVRQISQRLMTFPEGSIVGVRGDGKIVGYAVSQLVNHISTKSWAEQTGDGEIAKTHIPDGQIVYGVNMSGQHHGMGQAVIEYYYNTFVVSGRCNLLCLGSRLPSFRQWKKTNSGGIKRYLSEKKRGGFSIDAELKLYQKLGFEALWELEDYFPDPKSLNYGVMIIKK